MDGGADLASQPTPVKTLETVVTARREFTAASSSVVRDRDFLLRPHPRPADILQVVPGLYVNQHAGGGKANQLFLRGFDADHGTDVLLTVDGVPVNMVSHGHGQGYADLNWIIPELIQRVEVAKGPYSAQHGDFATAGAINLVTRDDFQTHQVTLGGGSFQTYRALLVASPRVGQLRTLIAGNVYGTNGPFESPERLERFSLFTKVSGRLAENATLSLILNSYSSGWNASGQVPLREVTLGRLARFGSIDPTEGGNSQRHSAQVSLGVRTEDQGELQLMAYVAQYRLNLFSNFTFFSGDPVHGDMIEQHDARLFGGFSGRYRFSRTLGPVAFETSFGVQLRTDAIENALHHSLARERLDTRVDASIREGSLGLYAQEDVRLTPWLRAILGLRADSFGFDVEDRLEDTATLGSGTSGVRQASLLSPKASLVFSAIPSTELYANFGSGFHSNDARGVVRRQEPVTPLTRALGMELGARSFLFDRVDLAGAVYLLDLASEIVWVGDEGTTEARGPTRRIGAEAELRVKILPWLFADASVSSATYVENAGNADAVALAPRTSPTPTGVRRSSPTSPGSPPRWMRPVAPQAPGPHRRTEHTPPSPAALLLAPAGVP
ncbi:MAG: TonB-dependent receptor, partial [Myxococcota bacterium]|nr:TonB-dependent receptor [Myxococcota bacterium]